VDKDELTDLSKRALAQKIKGSAFNNRVLTKHMLWAKALFILWNFIFIHELKLVATGDVEYQ
jgi:hypothetical protein